ncbi:amino acid adenylation domain-containing protein [Lachnospira multipara]|uniref:amino acid adenylation domain-containing protein n=1 Tax=Lachnospira multipara TaxID=28051 RepID=UPI0004873BFB|nr:amino acid adenylation domain-containing protein [Lachnospira multipara]
MKNVMEIFKEEVRRDERAVAVFDEERSLTRKELFALTKTIEAKLDKNLKRVGIIMDHSVEMIGAIFASLDLGAAYIPAEPTFPKERIRYMMEEAGVEIIITNSAYKELLPEFKKLIIDAGEEIRPDYLELDFNEEEEVDIKLAYILYTSGTTGKPKGVSVTHDNLRHYIRAFRNEFNPSKGDIMLQHSVCSFDIFVEEVFTSIMSGATLAIPTKETKEDITKLINFIDKNKVTMLSSFPYLLQELNDRELPESLRLLISGGDVIRATYVTNLLGKVEIYNTYGPSETTVCASYCRCSMENVLEDGTFPVGKPVLGTRIKIMDEMGREVPKGEIGEICIFGDGVSIGYMGDRAKENESFVNTADGRMYKSGDLGYILPDGNIAFLHRKDTQIMILGKRVEVSEVENVLLKSDMVRQAYVAAKTDANNLSYMVAYIVKEDKETKLTDIIAYLKDYLTDFMIPDFFVELRDLPLNSNGKVDKKALPNVAKKVA